MYNATEKIFEDQLLKLPAVVVDFISSTTWDAGLDEIGSMYNLTEEDLNRFKRETTLVLTGLVHPDEFHSTLEHEVNLHGSVLDAIVSATEEKIFAPVRPALIEFFEQEASETAEIQNVSHAKEILRAPQRIWEREPDIAPDNLPTDKEHESFLPPIPQKPTKADTDVPSWEITPTHPFEEKMKKVFTAGQQSMGDLTIEPATPQVTQPDTTRTYHADPYREPIE